MGLPPFFSPFHPPPLCFFLSCPLTAFVRLHTATLRCDGDGHICDTADVKEQSVLLDLHVDFTVKPINVRSNQKQLKPECCSHVVPRVTSEQCQDKCHTIAWYNTTRLWPLNNLSSASDMDKCLYPF